VSILSDKKYVNRLQSNCRNHNHLFKYFIEETTFDQGDREFLVYSAIARGELYKLRVLFNAGYDLATYRGIFDVALRYGRNEVVRYLRFTHKLDPNKYGHVLDFDNYKKDHRYIYY